MCFGVPQGSILGPVLFNLYVIELSNHITSASIQYADDTTIYRHSTVTKILGFVVATDAIIRTPYHFSKTNLDTLFNIVWQSWILHPSMTLLGLSILETENFQSPVCNENSTKERYELYFGNDNELPYCTCLSWEKTCYPCKHFFAVFRKFQAWSWDALSIIYLNSTFLNLDLDVIPIIEEKPVASPTPHPDEGEPEEMETSEPAELNEKPNQISELPKPKHWKASHSSFLRKLLKGIRDDSYLVSDRSILQDVCNDLAKIREKLGNAVPRENKLPLEPKPVTEKKLRFTPYSMPKEKKREKFHGRHGKTASENKTARKLKSK